MKMIERFRVTRVVLALMVSMVACVVEPVDEESVSAAEQELWNPTFCGTFWCPYGYTFLGNVCDDFCGPCPYGRYGSTPNASECWPSTPPTPSGSISATPENVLVATGSLGTSRICFSSNVEYSEVWVSWNGAPDTLFASERISGCANATWIQAGHTYEFRLYQGQAH